MTEVLQLSPSHFSSPSSSTSSPHALINSSASTVGTVGSICQDSDQEEESRLQEEEEEEERKERDREGDQLSLLTLLVAAFRKSLIGCSISDTKELCSMEIGVPTNVRHVAHVTFDRFHGFLGLPVEFEPEFESQAQCIVDTMRSLTIMNAWFRELPRGILDSLPPEQVIQSQSEEECAQLVRLLPPTEASLLNWAINLMADVVQLEHLNKMNARNIAMVFAPNMTQMSDPLTALMYAVQVMNFLKTLIIRTLKEREETVVDSTSVSRSEPSDKNGQQSSSQLQQDVNEEVQNQSEEEKVYVAQEPESPTDSTEEDLTTESNSQSFLTSIENICAGHRSLVDNCPCTMVSQVDSLANELQEGGLLSTSKKGRIGPSGGSSLKKGSKMANERPTGRAAGAVEKSKGTRIVGRINSRAELFEAWR
ncbi:PAK-box/P21-Rho-binding protein [Corchorus capsularis]|uniref:PAK-box/P21-Rho-binding protein n=1 Tax=Corchorus capsularis TaxID=210143 RepID=A0A1R3II64_COCAP|nr:PAK-box/P21-Rho-binding protein [Corchorus capsularis]